MTTKNNCWKCSAFRTNSDRYYDTGRFYYSCKRGSTNFPKLCNDYEYEPGSDHAVRVDERNEGKQNGHAD